MRFFLYGTLLAGSGNGVATDLHRKLAPGSPAEARGSLFAVPDPDGWYPALMHDPEGGPVRGVMHETLPPFSEADLAALDAYEGADYVRAEIPVEDGGLTFMAHAWVWAGALPSGAEPVPDGDFAAFLMRRGLRGFGFAG
ncbi:gamma-glutamylcyclotransferase [Novosphingobium flavum]|uniref:Gamma-glutamylcyclotransferase n=1 Tax=Novosphingobium flavum TaxID=1778672 RepID=A0A7X1FV07_9SPHN|nr:gamma-glutamylcyclotransferase [Novosphingobium flavum]